MTNFNGRFALGTKTASLQEPGLLGDEALTTAQRYDSATGMYVNLNSGLVTVKWVQNLSGSAIVPGTLVTADATNALDINVKTCGASDVPVGITDPYLTSNVANGESFLIITKASRAKAMASATYSKGAYLVPAASGKTASGSGTMMRALEAATAANTLYDIACNFVSP